MAATRRSQLQKRVLRWWATDAQRTQGVVASSRQAVCALQGGSWHSRSWRAHLGHAGLACHGPLGRWERRSPEAYPRGAEMGLPMCRKL